MNATAHKFRVVSGGKSKEEATPSDASRIKFTAIEGGEEPPKVVREQQPRSAFDVVLSRKTPFVQSGDIVNQSLKYQLINAFAEEQGIPFAWAESAFWSILQGDDARAEQTIKAGREQTKQAKTAIGAPYVS